MARLQAKLGEAVFATEHRAGRQMPTEEAMVQAIRLADELAHSAPSPATRQATGADRDTLRIVTRGEGEAPDYPAAERVGGRNA